ncbi:MAG: PucR family transcriptional regulator [Gordonia sp. (in: high G+C Gram-positive bacteria)]
MVMRVRDVVALPEIARGDPEVLSDRRWDDEIRWVHISDVPDLTGLLTGGELVLTTGAALANWPQRYLEALSASGAIGAIVELGSTLDRLPSGVARLARRENVALIVLHRVIKFVEVTEAVHRRIVAEQYDAVAFDRQVHATFTELSMNRAPATGIVDAASRMLDEPVVLEDLAHQVLAAAVTADSPAATVLTDWERRSRRSPGSSHPDPARREVVASHARAEPWVTVDVGPRGEMWGRLIVPRGPADPSRSRMVLERAAVALALDRMIERDRTGLQQRAQSGLLDDVLERRLSGESDATARAHALGLARSRAYLPLSIRLTRAADTTDPVAMTRRNSAAVEGLSQAVRAGHTALFTTRRDGDIVALIALSDRDVDQQLSMIASRIHDAARRLDGVTRCTIAVGEPGALLVPTIAALDDVVQVAEVAAAMEPGRHAFYRARDVRLRGLIALLRDDPRVQAFAETELRAVLAADPGLLTLLRAYLESGGNKAALAQRLHVSRPALYKRLATLEGLLGHDLADPESVVSLHVAILVHDARH